MCVCVLEKEIEGVRERERYFSIYTIHKLNHISDNTDIQMKNNLIIEGKRMQVSFVYRHYTSCSNNKNVNKINSVFMILHKSLKLYFSTQRVTMVSTQQLTVNQTLRGSLYTNLTVLGYKCSICFHITAIIQFKRVGFLYVINNNKCHNLLHFYYFNFIYSYSKC